MDDNIAQQADEIEVLKSIFEDQWHFNAETGSYSIEISKEIELWITLNPEYPSHSPPKYELLAPTLSKVQKELVHKDFRDIFEKEKGGPVIYQWIEKLKEIVSENVVCENVPSEETLTLQLEEKNESKEQLSIIHGPVIVDRKSTFQGHSCSITNQAQFGQFLDCLLENKKIANATHNISAYRISANNALLQDCDDDGETHAGGRLLHLLEILDVRNVAVVVSRWYGGVLLGPDRFKHINNAARQVLDQGGLIKPKQ